MTLQTKTLPLFPLPIFLLVGGRTRLRVFEAKYLDLVTVASQGDGFILSYQAQANRNSSLDHGYFGSWVKIVNFDKDEKGTLEIDVECTKVVKFTFSDWHKDKLNYVQVSPLSHWSEITQNSELNKYTAPLQDILDNTPILSSLYPSGVDQNLNWVLARWLELLPLPTKDNYFFTLSVEEAKDTLDSIIQ